MAMGQTMKIMLPVDGSTVSLHAVQHALRWRGAGLPASFVLVNVQAPPSLYEVAVVHDSRRLDEVRRSAGADLLASAEALLKGAGAEWESEVAGGDPGHVIVELCENYRCDAVVMGAGAPGRIGSVALSVLQHSPVPVTVVHVPAPVEF